MSLIAFAGVALPGQAGEGQAYGTQQRQRQRQQTRKTPEKDPPPGAREEEAANEIIVCDFS
jgi:hypothetical protein